MKSNVSSTFQFPDGIDVEGNLLGLPPPVALRNKTTDAIVQVMGLPLGVAGVTHLANHTLLRHDSPYVGVYLTQMRIVMEAEPRT